MRIRALLFGLLGMGLVKVAFGAWVAVTSPIADQVPTVGIQAAESNIWELNIVVPGLSVESFTEEGEAYDQVTLLDERLAGADGEAELPLISRMIALRTSGNPELEVVSSVFVRMGGWPWERTKWFIRIFATGTFPEYLVLRQ